MSQATHDVSEARVGVTYGFAAYSIWGFSAVYWKWLFDVGALEVLAHRVVWATLIIFGVLVYRRRLPMVWAMVRTPKVLGLLFLSGALLAANWSIFVWSVLSGQVLQSSLGYYINPLVNVVLGALLLGERMSRWQSAAVWLAAIGVLGMIVIGGSLPWPALTLAFTFAIYGYIRKVTGVVAMDALFVEMAIFAPVAMIVLVWLSGQGEMTFGSSDLLTSFLLIGGGLVTLLPLAFFGEAVRRVRLVTIGLLQYLAPTIQFVLAVAIFGEAFTPGHIVAFGFIWVGLLLYSFDALRGEHH